MHVYTKICTRVYVHVHMCAVCMRVYWFLVTGYWLGGGHSVTLTYPGSSPPAGRSPRLGVPLPWEFPSLGSSPQGFKKQAHKGITKWFTEGSPRVGLGLG